MLFLLLDIILWSSDVHIHSRDESFRACFLVHHLLVHSPARPPGFHATRSENNDARDIFLRHLGKHFDSQETIENACRPLLSFHESDNT